METTLDALLSSPMAGRALTAGVLLVLIYVAVYYMRRSIGRYVIDSNTRYLARKFVSLVGYFLGAGVLATFFSDRLAGLTVAFGLAGAGVAFALQEVIVSVAGWLAISFGGSYKTGDRVQLAGVKGDVIDISVLRTTLMELGEWVNGDLYSGRIVRVSNSALFKDSLFNYSADFPFLWDEIRIPIRHGSDRTATREVLLRASTEVTGEFAARSADGWKAVVQKYRIENARIEPLVTMEADENWMTFTLRYIVDYKRRRTVKDKLFERILSDIDASSGRIELASTSLELSSYNPMHIRVLSQETTQ
jgi:small-conductance mechanosensitive channel